MNFFKRSSAGICLLICFSQSVFSQPSSLNPVIVTGSLNDQLLSDALTSVSYIGREDIEKSQATTLADLLQGEPGIEFGRNGGLGSTTSFFLRGQNSKNIAIFIDGVRSQVDQVGALQLTDLPLAQIEKIEILRGNASALYGDSAVGGVINIFTRQGSETSSPFANLRLASHGLKAINTGYAGAVEDFKFNFQAGSQTSTGFSAMNTTQKPLANPDADGYFDEYFLMNLEKKITSVAALGLRVNHRYSENQYDDGSAFNNSTPADIHLQVKTSDLYGVYLHSKINPNWKSNLDLTVGQINYKDLLNGGVSTIYGFGRNTGDQKNIRWFNSYAVSDQTIANFGVDYSADELVFTGTDLNMDSYAMKRISKGVFAGMTHSLNAWTLQANVRRDFLNIENKDANAVITTIAPDATSGLIGVGYGLTSKWKVSTSISNGFSAPTAYDISQNKKLTPEKFLAKEIGLSYTHGNQWMRMVYFDMSTQNSIDYDDNGVASNTYASNNKGIESTGQAEFNGYRLKASLVVQHPRSTTYDEYLARRANQYGHLDISKRLGAYEFGTKIFASGRRKDSHYSADLLSGYTLVSAFVAGELDSNWSARVKLDNLFDQKYQLAYGYNTPGRTISATVSYQLR